MQFKIRNGIVGMSCAVYANNRLIYTNQTGYADRENRKRVSPDTWFRLGSISKPVTAVGAMKLWQQGRLDIDRDCGDYVPEWPSTHKKATVRQFLNHTSGVRHYQPLGDADGKMYYPTAAGAVGLFVRGPLRFEPGRQYAYSTHAYTLVARAMETVSGVPFQDYMRKEVFPYSGGGLDVEILLEKRNRSALYGEDRDGNVQHLYPREDNSWKFGGGGMEATAPGLARFLSAVMYAQVVNAESLRQMWSSAKLNNGAFSNYGLGYRLSQNGRVGHNGAQQGCRTGMMMDLNQHTVAVVLTNTEGGWDPSELTSALLDMAPDLAR